MKAVLQSIYGSADVLECIDIDEPVVGDGAVLIFKALPGRPPGKS
jgi:hypothetical protein